MILYANFHHYHHHHWHLLGIVQVALHVISFRHQYCLPHFRKLNHSKQCPGSRTWTPEIWLQSGCFTCLSHSVTGSQHGLLGMGKKKQGNLSSNPPLPLTGCQTMGKSHNLPEPGYRYSAGHGPGRFETLPVRPGSLEALPWHEARWTAFLLYSHWPSTEFHLKENDFEALKMLQPLDYSSTSEVPLSLMILQNH